MPPPPPVTMAVLFSYLCMAYSKVCEVVIFGFARLASGGQLSKDIVILLIGACKGVCAGFFETYGFPYEK